MIDENSKPGSSYYSNIYRIYYKYLHEYLECLVAQFYFQRAGHLSEVEGDAGLSSTAIAHYFRSNFSDLDLEFEALNAHISSVLSQIEKSEVIRKSANFVSDKFVTYYKTVLKYDELNGETKSSFQNLLEDESFRNAGKFSDLSLSYRIKLAQRYGSNRELDVFGNWDFPKEFDRDKHYALISREVQLEGRRPNEVSAARLEETKLKRNSMPPYQTYAEKWQSEVKPVRVFHGGGFLYLSRFLLQKTQGGQLQSGEDPRYGIWVSPVKDEEATVSTQYLDSVQNKYEAGFCSANLDKMSDIVLTVDDLGYKFEANNIGKMVSELKSMNLDQMLWLPY